MKIYIFSIIVSYLCQHKAEEAASDIADLLVRKDIVDPPCNY